MRTKEYELDHLNIAVDLALEALMKGRTFYEDYFKGQEFDQLSRTDQAICILLTRKGPGDLGEPNGLDKINRAIHTKYLDKKKQEL